VVIHISDKSAATDLRLEQKTGAAEYTAS